MSWITLGAFSPCGRADESGLILDMKFPDSRTLELSVLKVLERQGGIATTAEIDQHVVEDLRLTDDQVKLVRTGNRTEIQYRLAWVRTKAKKNGLIERTQNRTWKLTGPNPES